MASINYWSWTDLNCPAHVHGAGLPCLQCFTGFWWRCSFRVVANQFGFSLYLILSRVLLLFHRYWSSTVFLEHPVRRLAMEYHPSLPPLMRLRVVFYDLFERTQHAFAVGHALFVGCCSVWQLNDRQRSLKSYLQIIPITNHLSSPFYCSFGCSSWRKRLFSRHRRNSVRRLRNVCCHVTLV